MEFMDICIRAAGIEDLNHLLHQRRAMFKEMGYRDVSILDRVEELSRLYFMHALPTGGYKAWLAEESTGQVVGGGGIVVAAWPGYPGEELMERAWILNVYTEPGVRHCGVARRVMAAMIAWCRGRGFGAVSLHASPAGRPLYEAIGFQQTNEMSFELR
jgi:GNAT superfamily N-acetyltransferase